MLLEEKANPYLISKVDKNEERSNLEEACINNYIPIIELYIEQFDWNEATISKSLKLCKSQLAENLIKRKISRNKQGFCFFCHKKKTSKIHANN